MKVIDRILYKFDDLVCLYVYKIFVVIELLLIDEDYYVRVEGWEIIFNLVKVVGLVIMIFIMRFDIDNMDEYVCNIIVRVFVVVVFVLGIFFLLFFLKVVCKSKKFW